MVLAVDDVIDGMAAGQIDMAQIARRVVAVGEGSALSPGPNAVELAKNGL